ncbi:MAG TPA: RDD family protein [Flavobacteriaceae bacterium]|nr:RDD family protein [Flavobacteriaceae bacterium]
MNEIQVETAQNVQIEQNIANLGTRIAAFLLDILVIILYEILMMFLYDLLMSDNLIRGREIWVFSLVFGLPPFLYHLLLEMFNNGQSIGKALLKIRVVRLDGMPPRFSNYLIRWLLRFIDISISSGAVAIFVFLLNGKGQRLGDIAAKTTVISERKNVSLEGGLLITIPENYVPTYPQVTIFTDSEIQKIKDLYQNAKQNNDQKVMISLANRIADVLEIEYEQTPLAFIDRILSDYKYYTQQ